MATQFERETQGPFYLYGYGGGWSESYSRGQRGPSLADAIKQAEDMKARYGFNYVSLRDANRRSVWNCDHGTVI